MKANDPQNEDPQPPRFSPLLKHDDDDHVEHIDERWLVSYADMMTLLFGLFVMLYSMSTNFEEVQSAMTKQFSQNEVSKKEIQKIDPKDFEDLKSKMDLLTSQMEQVTNENTKMKVDLTDLNKVKSENEVLKQDIMTAEKLKTEIVNSQDSTAAIKLQLKELKLAKQKLEKELEKKADAQVDIVDFEKIKADNLSLKEKVSGLANLQKELAKLTALNKSLNQKISEVAREPASTPPPTEDLQKEVDELKLAKDQLEKKLKDTQETMSSMALPTPFAAVVITWPTADHDIDLIVTDPAGKIFNFKERKVSGHPGQFVLDSRRGPGAEMWQTDATLAGTYTLKYIFYNSYGNAEPATVFGTIYSSRGMFELPKVTLNFESKREQSFRFSISKKGEVTLLK